MTMNKLQWTKTKPKPTQNLLILTGTLCSDKWEYQLFEIDKTDLEDGWYWGIFTPDGDEWGAYADLSADKYCLIKPLKSK
jgi:hypothetical protein